MQINLLESQSEFLRSKSKKALLLAGIGYGKSFIGSHFVINMVSRYPNSNGLITANTYTQLINASVHTFLSELDRLGVPYDKVTGGANKHVRIGNTKIYLYSLERPDTIRGIEVGWWWSDESCFAKEDAIQICRGRLRDSRGPLYERHTSSPNGYNWAYDTFENHDKNNITDNVGLYRGVTRDNIFLPEGYYESILEDYGGEANPLAQQELFGQFTNLGEGAIYWGFDRNRLVQPCKLDPDFPVYVGQDFNISNMEGVYVQYKHGNFYVCKESILEHHGANTDEAATKIVKDLKGFRVLVIPDSTGRALKTSASGRTDIEILRRYGLEVMATRNPFVRDRQNTLNNHMKQNKLFIDPSCKTLIKELEVLSARDKEGDKAHASVALGYVTWKLAPLKRERLSSSINV